jgi:hypothetical protein
MSPKRRLEPLARNGAVRHSPCRFRMVCRSGSSHSHAWARGALARLGLNALW